MNRKEFGALIAALRREQFDPIEGKSWTQSVLAEKTNLSQRTIEEIERGAKAGIDSDTLVRLANAFQLSTVERMRFITLASNVENADILINPTSPAKTLEEAKLFFQEMRLPALVYDAFYNIVMINHPFLRLYQVSEHFFDPAMTCSAKFNILRFFFDKDSPVMAAFGMIPEELALVNVQYFRALSFEYRHTEYFTSLFKDLARYPKFTKFWENIKYEPSDLYNRWKEETYYHQQYGTLRYVITTTPLLTLPYNLYLSVYLPKSLQTQDTFAHIAQEVGTVTKHLQLWPHRIFIDE
jgi:transcriptional regulator with XRE-family HTH domain